MLRWKFKKCITARKQNNFTSDQRQSIIKICDVSGFPMSLTYVLKTGIQHDLSDSQALHSTWKAVTAAADTHLRDQVPKAYKVTAERIFT
jgi:hypothetical protein